MQAEKVHDLLRTSPRMAPDTREPVTGCRQATVGCRKAVGHVVEQALSLCQIGGILGRMPRFAANISLLYPEYPFEDRFAAAARSGFSAVECQFPYALPARRCRDLLDRHGLRLVLHNLPAGDWATGERGIACLADRQVEFREGVEQALAHARITGVRKLNCLAGLLPEGADPAEARSVMGANLRYAQARLSPHGIGLVVEAINTWDMPRFLLPTVQEVLHLLDRQQVPGVKVQLDFYHVTRMGQEALPLLARYLPRIGHLQLADAPGRHEPGTGRIPFRTWLRWLDAAGYGGYVGCEYVPARGGVGGTDAGLAWMARLGYAPGSSGPSA